jgi:hypothetical protein
MGETYPMKKLAVTLGMALLMGSLLATPVFAAAQRVTLAPCADVQVVGCADAKGVLHGGGFVVFNNTSGPDNLLVTVSLKGVEPSRAFDIYLFVDSASASVAGFGKPLGTVTTNRQGNATFHGTWKVLMGVHDLGLDIVYHGDANGSDRYLSAGFTSKPSFSARMTFK